MSAEGIIGVQTQNNSDFFCHVCHQHFSLRNPTDFTCPLCKLGFIEQLIETVEVEDTTNLLDNSSEELSRFLEVFPRGIIRSNNPANTYYRLANEIISPILSVASGSGSGSGSRGVNYRRRTARTAALDALNQEMTVTVGTSSDSRSMIVMGNPRDYAWGRGGLEAVMSQLLNQFDIAAQPPLTKDQINDISKESITREQVDTKLQCAICFDEFQLEETVRKLDCNHFYHEQCIFPWVKQHATCPVCRKNLSTDYDSSENNVSSEVSFRMAIRAAVENRDLNRGISSARRQNTNAVLNIERSQSYQSSQSTMPDVIPNPLVRSNSDIAEYTNTFRECTSPLLSSPISFSSISPSTSISSTSSSSSDDIINISDNSSHHEQQSSDPNEECSQPLLKRSKSN